jgi:hypothetical protein
VKELVVEPFKMGEVMLPAVPGVPVMMKDIVAESLVAR